MNNFKISRIHYKPFLTIIIILIILVVTKPTVSINSAKEGLDLWFNILIPSLFPFFILSELLISLKFVDFFGSLLKPIMKPVFNLPGQAAFPLIMSLMSGYPVGIKLTTRLREENIINREDGNRLICFVSTSGPLFILGAVLIGMLNSPKLGPLIILPHYLGAITLGLLVSRIKPKDRKTNVSGNVFKNNNSYNNLDNSSTSKSSIGLLISKSIKDSIDSILLIGGFVIIYSVVIELLFTSKAFNSLILMSSNYFKVKPDLIKGIIAGLIELTTGCKRIAASDLNIIIKIIFCNFIIGWGGLSIHSQSISFISLTDLNTYLYLFSKFLHGILSVIYTYIIYVFFYKNTYIPSMFTESYLISSGFYSWIYLFMNSIKISILLIVYFIIFSLLVYQFQERKS